MAQEKQKEALVSAAKSLLEESEEPENVTSRAIAERAGVNAAMINYYFQSKDQLLTAAVGEIISASANQFSMPERTLPPRQRLQKILWEICRDVLRYRQYSKIFVPQILLNGEIECPFYILPDIRAYFNGRKSETECRVIAYQLVSFLQLAFYRSDAFFKYTGVDLTEEKECKKMLNLELDLLLPEE